MGIDNAKNAAMLAIEILALSDEMLSKKLKEFRGRKINKLLLQLRTVR